MMNSTIFVVCILLSTTIKIILAQEMLTNSSDTKNLIDLYQSQKLLLSEIFTNQTLDLKKLFITILLDIYDNPKFEKIDKADCFENPKEELSSLFEIALDKNGQCWINEISTFDNEVNLMIQSSDVQQTFPLCFKSISFPIESLTCIDQHVNNLDDANTTLIYQKIYSHLKNISDLPISTSNITCMKIFLEIMNPILPYMKEKFTTCVKEKALLKIITCTDQEIECELSAVNVNLSFQLKTLNLTTLNIVSVAILKIMKQKYESMIQTHIDTLNTRLQNDVDSTDIRVKNITCCLTFNKVLLDAAMKFALNESNHCFNNELSSFHNNVSLIVQKKDLKWGFISCYRKNLSESGIINCLDQILWKKTPNIKKLYETAIDDIKKRVDLFTSNTNLCMKTSSNAFSQSLTHASSRFDKCKEYQKLLCHDPYITNDDYKILSYVRITKNKQLKELFPEMKRPMAVPKLG